MRIFISVDIEGVAGVATTDACVAGRHGYDDACRWMTAEVCAAIEGARSAGGTEFIVADSHARADNLILDQLPDDIEVIRSWPRPLAMMQGVESGCERAFCVGYHTGAHETRGILAHTFRGLQISEVEVNGSPVSELTFNALLAAEHGVPVTLVTGDKATCDHAEAELGKIVTAAVKTDHGRLSAQTLTPRAACRLISEQATEAVRMPLPEPASFKAPLAVKIVFKHHWTAELISYLPFVERLGPYQVAFEADKPSTASKIITVITSYSPLPPPV